MKFSTTLALALPVFAHAASITKRQDSSPSCSIPCTEKPAKEFTCDGTLRQCYCDSAANVQKESEQCVTQCGISVETQKQVLAGVEAVCNGGPPDPKACADTCTLAATAEIQCNGDTLHTCNCENIEKISAEAADCLMTNCGLTKGTLDDIAEGAKKYCAESSVN